MTLTEPPVTLQPFTIATALLKKLVTHQATTIERAIAEAVMNAVDAGAKWILELRRPSPLLAYRGYLRLS
ncbi:hypothetical protein [Deinococcus enclensis]|uniref:Uncharacterized protein n=1 Tax=Deinococcus enclensis TaxID=1049582 RepID=A0ABT9MFK7_9DEIO|nr:hypothetical protein [Deinococcus enclensis]MDP9765362.1 hypothetical protein [Deinococcus enclensis]